MSKRDGGPAFPGAVLPEHPNHPGGMTLRDWFAGQALASSLDVAMQLSRDASPAPMTASLAYEIADAMLAAREEQS